MTEQLATEKETAPRQPRTPFQWPDWESAFRWPNWLLILWVLTVGEAGHYVGEWAGACWSGAGRATGADVGGWLGRFLGLWAGFAAGCALAALLRPDRFPRLYALQVIAIFLFVFLLLGVAGAAGTAIGGPFAGFAAAFLVLGATLGLAAAVTQRRPR
jgi:hypothetical protein